MQPPRSLCLSSKQILSPGYAFVYDDQQLNDSPLSRVVTSLTQGQRVRLMASAKKNLVSESRLILLLKRLKIGRPSTYAIIIQTLEQHGFISISEDRYLSVSNLGGKVLRFLKSSAPFLLDATWTALLEEKLDELENAKSTYESTVGSVWDVLSKFSEEK